MKKINLIILVILALALAGIFGYAARSIYFGSKNLGPEKIITVTSGESAKEISQSLSQAGLIQNPLIFRTYLWLSGSTGHLQAGEYRLAIGLSLREIVNRLISGRTNNEREIKIIEGWTRNDLANYFNQEGVMSRDDLLSQTSDIKKWQAQWDFLADAPADATLEGFLFPDTYRIYRQGKSEEIIKKLLQNFDRKLTPGLRRDIKDSKKTIFEVITLASIIEKEVSDSTDRPLVADLFYRRLRVGMPLQADSTVNFITGGKTASLSAADQEINSPYNTYKYRGLPPGPISNPSLEAIRAAIYPTKNNFWYFLTTPDGKTIFSKTLEEHNLAKEQYLNN